MNRFDGFKRLAWSLFVVCTLAFALTGCEGSDGAPGAAGPAGPAGPTGPEGPPGTGVEPIDAAKLESCGTCHGGAGDDHQDIYNPYTAPSVFTLTFDDVTSVPDGAGGFTFTLDFTITKSGAPFVAPVGLPPAVESTSFYVVQYDSGTGEFIKSGTGFFPSLNASLAASNGDGTYTLTQTLDYDVSAFGGGAIVGRIADGRIDIEEGQYDPAAGKRVQMFAELASASYPIGDIGTFTSLANVDGCIACHNAPYRKHGNIEAVVADIPNFGYCKACHSDDRAGGHEDWQYMVDEPFNWATGVVSTADYSYTANLMNDTHMSHAMEFPYPQSMQNCDTCHNGMLTQVLDDTNFTAETCLSCHPVQGVDAWPGETYAQSHRAPALDYLWTRGADLSFHDITSNCTGCHGAAGVSGSFTAYHTGYDVNITDDTGQRYSDLYTVSIDQITLAGNLLTVNFSSSDPAVAAELLISLYGWDSKHFIIASHTRDGSDLCPSSRGDGCRMEFESGDTSPLFTEDAASVPGNWMVTLDLAAYVPTTFLPEDIPTLIADGVIKKAEVTVTPELDLGGTEVVLMAANETFDLGSSLIVDDYFKGANAVVSTDKCNACHDALASTFHSESGRSGDGIEVCKNCHVTTSPGSHLEMASRAIDSYVHAIHSFQPFDLDDVATADDPVFDARTALHTGHVLPHFTIKNCESCHVAGTFNVPDQSQSMPGVLRASWDIADRNIGNVPEAVTGPASRACGGCHRVELINEDLAGDLASFNAHTESFGTLVENDAEDTILYGIIDKIMSLFE